ncbi:MAG: Co2+/Mg2+ efflux protein ApaG [Cytophagales bacterium]|nr:Co2+/Mg2+ efflux protein ApaG [Cytophagales bacterium]
MVTEITNGIKVSVKTEYQSEYSSPMQMHYVFTYQIKIENKSSYTIQLLSRRWNIFDANGQIREIEGEGVVGSKPIIEPGSSHQYISGCNLKSGIGKMNGSYLFERILNGEKFLVKIPEFNMCVPFRLN